MLIGIISDTHDNLPGLKKAIEIFKKRKVQMIIHCGDWVSPFTLEFFDEQLKGFNIPVKSVIGNNPGDIKRTILSSSKMQNPVEFASRITLALDLNGIKAIIYHGDDYELLQGLIDSQKYDVIFTGHTHKPRNEVIGKTLIINPGSTSYACEAKIIKQASIAIYNSKVNTAEIISY